MTFPWSAVARIMIQLIYIPPLYRLTLANTALEAHRVSMALEGRQQARIHLSISSTYHIVESWLDLV